MLVAMVTIATAMASASPAAAAPTVPPDFEDRLVANVGAAGQVAFTPDGRMLIASRFGALRIYTNGSLLSTHALNLSPKLCPDRERGLLGLAVHPDFASNRYIYLFYTHKKHGTCEYNTPRSPVNRISRFVLPSTNVINPASETVMVDNMPSPDGIHNAGGLGFGNDGYLYASIGDGGCDYSGTGGCAGGNDAARDQHVLTGKLLRITPSGGIPADNPFRGPDSARCNLTGRTDPGKKCQETYAWGLRNPWRFAFDPNAAGTRLFINDVGQVTWEEVNLGQAGADYGWNVREGLCARDSTIDCGPPPSGMTNPLYAYSHGSGCTAITGGAFIANGAWPETYDGRYFFGDFTCGKIRTLRPTYLGWLASDFASDLEGVVDLTFGPHGADQALYYITYTASQGEQVRRISYNSGNRLPVAVAEATPTFGGVPLTVAFDGSASSDPDGDVLSYDWDFGDGTPHSTSASPSHTYTSAGTHTARLRVTDPGGASATRTVRIDVGNTPPAPAIQSPSPSLQFRVGQRITLRGSAADAEDGNLAASRLEWDVVLHHGSHEHPFLAPTTGNDVAFDAPAPEDLTAAATSYLEIRLKATDSKGLSRTISQDLGPHLVPIIFTTEPPGLQLDVDGTRTGTPNFFVSWEGFDVRVNAPLQASSGKLWAPASWSDGGAISHTIVTPSSPTIYTATFSGAQCGAGVGTGLVLLTLCGFPYWRRRLRRRVAGIEPTLPR